MDIGRRFSLLVTTGSLGIAVMLGAVTSRSTVSADAASSLARSTRFFDSMVVLARNARPRGIRGDQLAISLGYLERLRLGMGSPFRLAHEALSDPRLDTVMSARTAWGLLGRLRRGDAYVVDPTVLDGSGPWNSDGIGATGAAHVALIEHTVRSATDPRAGELAVRLAYSIAAAKGSVVSPSVGIAAQVAALVRDRESAERDLSDLLSDASETNGSVLALLTQRRASHAFRVERPPLATLNSDLQIEAMEIAPAVVQAIDTLDRAAAPEMAGGAARAKAMNAIFAGRLEALGAQRPALAQVGVSLGTRSQISLRGTNEETLIASSIRVSPSSDSVRRANALVMLSSAVALRTLAQSRPWFPGDGGPDAADLTSEFGLADVVFARTVPMSWRPYYLRELQTSLRDVNSVLPALSLSGLHVRFGSEPLRDSALAMHDPRSRTLQLSVFTSAGTLAHELSHDLDWQAARRLYADGSGYSTDRAMREHRGALSSSLRGLAEARLLRPFSATSPAAVGRPAELFARGADWFVTSSLAQQGRSNSFLSVISDPMLSGYAAGPPTAMGYAGARSLLSAIEEMTYVPDSIADRFSSQWSDPRVVDPVLLVRRVMETPIVVRGSMRVQQTAAPIVASAQPAICGADNSRETKARQSILMLAIDARAAGIVARRARFASESMRTAWANGATGVAPWSATEAERIRAWYRATITTELTTAQADQGIVPLVPRLFCVPG